MIVVADTSVLISLCRVRQGILGLLLRAKSSGFLTELKPVLNALQQDAGFWLSESLRNQILNAAGEKT